MNLPNALTVARGVLAIIFFVLLYPALGWRPQEMGSAAERPDLLPALLVFLAAMATDFLDGWLARRWNMTSRFGRVADPLVDKVLVSGAFILFAAFPGWGVHPVAVALILAREFLISRLRALAEARGIDFGALAGGKFKMAVQTAAVLWILVVGQYTFQDGAREAYIVPVVWITVAVTLWSAVPYLRRWFQLNPRPTERV